jgi:hypothetical protein
MAADRYVKTILTIIACELLWLGLRDTAPPVAAQGAPTPVVITGIRLDQESGGFLPVGIVGSYRQVPPRHGAMLEPHAVRVPAPIHIESRTPLKVESDRPLKIEADHPLKIEADHPLKVESVGYTPKARPG